MSGAGAAKGGGAALSAFGQVESGRAGVKDAKAAAKLARARAKEILERAKINVDVALKEGQKLAGAQVSAFARGGVDVSSGSPLLVQEVALSDAKQQAIVIDREATFQAGQLRKEARNLVKSARKARGIGNIAAIGTIIGGAGRAASS